MLFNSHIFILLFLPMAVGGYFILNHFKKQNAATVFLFVMSLWFYAYFNISYLPLILMSIAVNYSVYRLMQKSESATVRRLLLALGVCFDLGLLFYYKYFDFFSENINALFSADLPLRSLILPLGISFFTFQQLSFVIDSYRREAGEYAFFDYALFVTFFPQLIAGPIVTHEELIPQFADIKKRSHSWDNIARGTYLFVLGLAKKVLLADVFGIAVNCAFADVASLTTGEALCAMLGYTLQIYLDFSGYCDMAAGMAKMMNIDLPENFNSPYKAHSIVEFWRRWHMTLTRFFTKYVYFPLGGSKRGAVRTYVNIMIVFLVSGIWHGAAWTFVLWGILHGGMSVLTRLAERACKKITKSKIPPAAPLRGSAAAAPSLRMTQDEKRNSLFNKSKIPPAAPLRGSASAVPSLRMTQGEKRNSLFSKRIPKLVGVMVTFAFVAFTWVLFRARSISDALVFFERLFSDGTLTLRAEITRAFAQSELTLALTTLLRFNPYTKFPPALMLGYFALSLEIVFFAPNARELERRFSATVPRLIITCVLLVWCLYSLSGVSTFLYFNF